jgi:hypothetical protein
MRFDSFDTDLQQAGDLLVGVTLGNELNNATFPVRQRRSRVVNGRARATYSAT